MNEHLTQSRATQPSSNKQTLSDPLAGSAQTAWPTHAEIAKRAYEIYVKSGHQQGHCQRNWLCAEQELRKHAMAASHSHSSGSR